MSVSKNTKDSSTFGATMPGRNYNSTEYNYGFNGQMKTDEISGAGNHYTAEFWEYDPRLGRRWNLDPVDKPWQSRYHAFSNSPIWKVDPNGANDDEYDKDGNKISDLGGDKVNFYHQANGDTKVEDQQTCATNTIKGGEALIRGFAQRDASTSWSTIFQEWDSGNGPEKSMFSDFTGSSKTGPFNSLHSTFSSYSSPARATSLTSPDKKGMVTMNYGNANPLVAQDMWEQMWGRSNVSWYKLGDKTMFMMTDSKSMTSFAYRALPSWERSSFKLNGNTYQTYIWIENNSTIQNKVTEKNNYIHQEFQKILNDSQHPTGAKY